MKNSLQMHVNHIITITLVFLIKSNNSDSECCFNSSLAVRDNQYVALSGFSQLSELKFNCNATLRMAVWEIHPSVQLILNNSLNLTDMSGIESTGEFFTVSFKNFLGFDVSSNPFQNINLVNYDKKFVWWALENSKFDFYLNNLPIEKHDCNQNLPANSIISTARILDLRKTKFSTSSCTFIFRNAYILLLSVSRLSSSLIETNILNFEKKKSKKLNSTIFQAQFDFYHSPLNDQTLNQHVFRRTEVLDLNGVISSIQPNLFESFSSLRLLRIRSQKINKFLVHSNKWLKSINKGLQVNLSNTDEVDKNLGFSFILVFYQAFANVLFYDFPEQDFCQLVDFPHERLVFPILKPISLSKCTCTELYLIQHSALFANSIQKLILNTPSTYAYMEYYSESLFVNEFSKCLNSSFKKMIARCNFTKRKNSCRIQSISKANQGTSDFLFYVYDWIEMSDVIHSVLTRYANLIFASIGVSVNLIFILILTNKTVMKDKMYKYLLINSLFNLVYSLTLMVKFTLSYIENRDSNRFSHTIHAQYMNLILMKFCLNVFRTGANISYFSFSLSRYISITNKRGPVWDTFHQMTTKMFSLILLVLAVVINIQVFFQFKIKTSQSDFEQMHSFNLKNFSNYYKQEPIDDYKEIFSSQSEFILLKVAQYIRLIFGDLVHIVASTAVDIALFTFVKNKMKLKRSLLQVNTVLSLVVMSRIEKRKVKKHHKKSKDRISQMIILNNINFVIFKFPLALLSFYGFLFRYNRETMRYEPDLASYIVCKKKSFCISLHEMFLCFCLISFLFQFLIFYNLDINFKESIRSIKTKCCLNRKSNQTERSAENYEHEMVTSF